MTFVWVAREGDEAVIAVCGTYGTALRACERDARSSIRRSMAETPSEWDDHAAFPLTMAVRASRGRSLFVIDALKATGDLWAVYQIQRHKVSP